MRFWHLFIANSRGVNLAGLYRYTAKGHELTFCVLVASGKLRVAGDFCQCNLLLATRNLPPDEMSLCSLTEYINYFWFARRPFSVNVECGDWATKPKTIMVNHFLE